MSFGIVSALRRAVASPFGKQEGSIDRSSWEAMESHPQHLPDWANLSVLHRNTLPPRANFVLYNNEEHALSRDVTQGETQCLSGKWKFLLTNSPFEAPSGFEATSFDSSEWREIAVPGMWQLQGFGRGPHYTNVQFPWFVDPPTPPYTDNECGSYITQFLVSKGIQDRQLRLRFEGVDSAFHVWINGHEVGYSQGSRNPSEFDITQYVERDKQNTLAVRVYQFCDGSYIEDQVSLRSRHQESSTTHRRRTNGGSVGSFAMCSCWAFRKRLALRMLLSRLSLTTNIKMRSYRYKWK